MAGRVLGLSGAIREEVHALNEKASLQAAFTRPLDRFTHVNETSWKNRQMARVYDALKARDHLVQRPHSRS